MKIKKILKVAAYATAFTAIYNKSVAILSGCYNRLKSSDGHIFNWDYGKIFYKKIGDGEPIILLHDLNSASSGYEWCKLEEKLAENNTVYTLDLLGCGRSDKPGINYSNFLYVKLLSVFLKEVVGERCTILCSGNSSSFSILGSTFNAQLVKKVICINPASPYGYSHTANFKKKLTDTILSVPIYGTTLYNHYLSQTKLQKLFENKYFFSKSDDIKQHIEYYHEAAHKKLRFARCFLAAEKLNHCILPVKHVLSELKFDFEIIFGQEEEKSKEISEAYQKFNNKIKISFVPNTKHLPHLENADAILQLINE